MNTSSNQGKNVNLNNNMVITNTCDYFFQCGI